MVAITSFGGDDPSLQAQLSLFCVHMVAPTGDDAATQLELGALESSRRKVVAAVMAGLRAETVWAEAVAAAETIGDEEVVIKSQILAGGRGLGTFTNGLQGGVHVIKTAEVEEYASKMLGGTLVTKQSGAEGKPVNQLLLAKKMDLVNEMYFAILLDRASGGPVIIACSEGGTSIEDLAESNPEAIVKVPIHPIEVIFLEWSEVSEKDGAADSSGWR